MPTGYTAKLMETGVDFRTFVLTCARAMGACIMQRDDPMSDPPKKQEPSDYYTKALKTAKDALVRLKAMSPNQQVAHGAKLRLAAVRSAAEGLAKSQAENDRLEAMAAQVGEWKPPTTEHDGLRDFMLQQIKISKHDLKWTQQWLADAESKTTLEYFADDLAKATRDIGYYEEELSKESSRTDERNEWIEKLYNSLPAARN